ncbi:MOSC domain-containing protein [Fusarium heterosporum]|uniref:MOSC domain-containing protein n=1 Tax=Fusarium heterosporum TaxID=42747 RepID=A0A8H5WQH7_FUSHE|nr:MOSC domain-containing protein [Fusarium heterosporum]
MFQILQQGIGSMNNFALAGFILSLQALVISSYLLISQRRRVHETGLQITRLYVYPVKGIRGCATTKARISPYGFEGDRTFSLQKVRRNNGSEISYETMLIGYDLKLALFTSSIDYDNGRVTIKWTGGQTDDSIHFPLKPSIDGRETIEASLHMSKAKAYDMGDELSKWFSDRLEQDVRLVYIGNQSRDVLGSLAPHSPEALKKAPLIQQIKNTIPIFHKAPEKIAFNDLAHYLVVTEESNDEVSSRLDDGLSMDITKFRPNIVVRGASKPFAEDFWGQLTFDGGVQMDLTSNCFRCQSITVDYETGKAATDDSGKVWKKLNKDRRVDKGAKYSPVFGRYGFCHGGDISKFLAVGQRLDVTRINDQRTTFDWPHLTTFGVSEKK